MARTGRAVSGRGLGYTASSAHVRPAVSARACTGRVARWGSGAGPGLPAAGNRGGGGAAGAGVTGSGFTAEGVTGLWGWIARLGSARTRRGRACTGGDPQPPRSVVSSRLRWLVAGRRRARSAGARTSRRAHRADCHQRQPLVLSPEPATAGGFPPACLGGRGRTALSEGWIPAHLAKAGSLCRLGEGGIRVTEWSGFWGRMGWVLLGGGGGGLRGARRAVCRGSR
jgi:hypothetical protein